MWVAHRYEKGSVYVGGKSDVQELKNITKYGPGLSHPVGLDYSMQGLLATAILSDEKGNRKPRVTGDRRETTYKHSGLFQTRDPS